MSVLGSCAGGDKHSYIYSAWIDRLLSTTFSGVIYVKIFGCFFYINLVLFFISSVHLPMGARGSFRYMRKRTYLKALFTASLVCVRA